MYRLEESHWCASSWARFEPGKVAQWETHLHTSAFVFQRNQEIIGMLSSCSMILYIMEIHNTRGGLTNVSASMEKPVCKFLSAIVSLAASRSGYPNCAPVLLFSKQIKTLFGMCLSCSWFIVYWGGHCMGCLFQEFPQLIRLHPRIPFKLLTNSKRNLRAERCRNSHCYGDPVHGEFPVEQIECSIPSRLHGQKTLCTSLQCFFLAEISVGSPQKNVIFII